jgi:glycosyltransferase involved in cell wall biosynthesis
MVGLPAAGLAHVPVRLIHVHSVASSGGSKRVNAVSTRLLSRLADGVIYCSQTVKDALDRRRDSRLHVIPNGVAFGQEPPRRRSPTGDTRPLVAIGRLERVKGFDVLLRALVAVRRAMPDVSLRIAGDGALRGELEHLCSALRLIESVEFHGFVDDVQGLLRSAEVFVMPSRWEGLPISLLEAVALGVPVVATGVGANRELIEDGRTGRLIPSEDAEALADAIVSQLERPEDAARMAERAFLELRRGYSLEAMVQSVNQLYESVLDAKRR